MTKHLLHQLRQDGDGLVFYCKWKRNPITSTFRAECLAYYPCGEKWKPTLWNTRSMARQYPSLTIRKKKQPLWEGVNLLRSDSLLFHLKTCGKRAYVPDECVRPAIADGSALAALRLEGNLMLLMDQAMYALDNEQWQPMEELLRIRQKLHRRWDEDQRMATVAASGGKNRNIHSGCVSAFTAQWAASCPDCRLAMEKGEVSLLAGWTTYCSY